MEDRNETIHEISMKSLPFDDKIHGEQNGNESTPTMQTSSSEVKSQHHIPTGDIKDSADFEFPFFQEMPSFLENHYTSLMAQVLTPELFHQLNPLQTSHNFTLSNIILPGILEPHIEVGVMAGDDECYLHYHPLFYPIIQSIHHHDPYTTYQQHDLHLSSIDFPSTTQELFQQHVVYASVSVMRNIGGLAYPNAALSQDRALVEHLLLQACGQSLSQHYPGVYYPIDSLSESLLQSLQTQGVLPGLTPELLATGAGRDWPSARGIYLPQQEGVCVWMNHSEHVRIVGHQRLRGNEWLSMIQQVYQIEHLISEGLVALSPSNKEGRYYPIVLGDEMMSIAPYGVSNTSHTPSSYAWSWLPQLGYLTSSVQTLGTTLQLSLILSLPHFSALYCNKHHFNTVTNATNATPLDHSLAQVLSILCTAYDLTLCPFVATSDTNLSHLTFPFTESNTPSVTAEHLFVIQNAHSLGRSEIQIIQTMIDGIVKIIQYEELLGTGVYPIIVYELIRRELATCGRYAFAKSESMFGGAMETPSQKAKEEEFNAAATTTAAGGTKSKRKKTKKRRVQQGYFNEEGVYVAFEQEQEQEQPQEIQQEQYPIETINSSSQQYDNIAVTTANNNPLSCQYLVHQLESISYKPILSVGNYISLDGECLVAGCSDRKLRFYTLAPPASSSPVVTTATDATVDTDEMQTTPTPTPMVTEEKKVLQEIGCTVVEKRNVNFVTISEMSPEGEDPVVLTGGKDCTIHVWHAPVSENDQTIMTNNAIQQHNTMKMITLPTQEVRSMAVYQGSFVLLVVIGTKDGKVFVWDINHDCLVAMFPGHKASVHCVCISLISSELMNCEAEEIDALCIASGSADRSARTWYIPTASLCKRFSHERSISSILITNKSAARALLVTAGVERRIKVWDLSTGMLLRVFTGHLDQINTLALYEGLQLLLISGSADHTLRVYDLLSGECMAVLTGHRDAVLSVTVTNTMDRPMIISSSEDLSLIQWDLATLLQDYYLMDETTVAAECLGMRNDCYPVLPCISYQAPEELDRNQLTKDQRKQIRRERKKQQRLRNLLNDWQAYQLITPTSDHNNTDSNNEHEHEHNNIGGVQEETIQMEIDALQRNIDSLQQQQQQHPLLATSSSCDFTSTTTTNATLTINTITASSTINTNENEIEPTVLAVTTSRTRLTKAELTFSSTRLQLAEDGNNGTHQHRGLSPSSSQRTLSLPRTSSQAQGLAALKHMGSATSLLPSLRLHSHVHSNPQTPKSMRKVASQPNSVKVMPSNSPPMDMKAQHHLQQQQQQPCEQVQEGEESCLSTSSSSQHLVINTTSQHFLSNLWKKVFGYNGASVGVEIPVPVLPTTSTPSIAAAATNHTHSKPQLDIIITNNTNNNNTNTNNNSNSNITANNSFVSTSPLSSPQTQSVVAVVVQSKVKAEDKDKEEEDYKRLAQATHTKYHAAVVEHTIQTDRKRNAASEKLAMRLQLKKQLSSPQGSFDLQTPLLSPRVAAGSDDNEQHQQQQQAAEHEQVKAEKLKQHKLQEIRRKQSMAVAKERSANALQKRLEELANRKKKIQEGNVRSRSFSGTVIEEGEEGEEEGERGEEEEEASDDD